MINQNSRIKKWIIPAGIGLGFIIVGTVGALNGWYGGGGSIPEDTFTRGLVAYWSFDEGSGTTTYDASSNGNNGTIYGAEWTKGKYGSALQFDVDGSDDYVDCGNDSSLDVANGTSPFTIEAWVYVNNCSAINFIVSKYSSYQFRIGGDDNSLELFDANDWSYSSANYVCVENEWIHVVAVYNGSDSSVYKNGVDVTEWGTEDNDWATSSVHLLVGRESADWEGGFNGRIDEVRIYNRALSAEEIRYHYNRGGPVAHWRFDEGSGSTVYDSTSNNNDGTINGASWVTGKYGAALKFDGVDDYVNCEYNSSLSLTKNFTVEAWINANTLGLNDWLMSGRGGVAGYAIGFDTNNYIRFTKCGKIVLHTDDTVSTNTWHHIASVVRDDYSVIIYVDGVLVHEFTDTQSLIQNTQYPTRIGCDVNSSGDPLYFFNGIIDDVRIYNYARTPDEIRLDYNAGLAVKLGGSPSGTFAGSNLLPAWKYRRSIEISGNTSDLTDYQVKIELPASLTSSLVSSNKLQSDFDDIRFTDADDNQLLNFWIEKATTTATSTIWVKVPSLSANKSSVIYMYYGNSSASSASDGEAVFEFFDDFEDGVIDTSKWTAPGCEETGGELIINRYYSEEYLQSTNNFSPGNATRFRIWYTSDTDFLEMGFAETPSTIPQMGDDAAEVFEAYTDSTLRGTSEDDAGNMQATSIGDYSNSYHTYDILWKSDEAKFYIDDDLKVTHTTAICDLSVPFTVSYPYAAGSYEARLDWVLIRKYASTEPSATVGDEQENITPVAHWRFEEGSGSTAYDSSRNSNNGTINGATWVDGKFGKALSFDGINDYVEVPDPGQKLAPDGFTFTAWIKILPGWSEYDRIVTKKGNLAWDAPTGWSLEINSGGKMTFLGSGDTYGDRLNMGWRENTWHFIAITKEAGATIVKGYLDGEYKDSQTCDTISPNAQSLTLAYYPGQGRYLPAIIDDARIYNYTRTPDEIRLDYNAGLAVKLAGSPTDIFTGSNLLPAWKYRRSIEISGNTSDLTDYQVKIELPASLTSSLVSSNKLQSDFDDIRFTDADDNQLLNFWIEKATTTATSTIWVKVPSLSANKSSVIYMYYGNSSASSASDGEAVFEFFDDFEDGTWSDKWLQSRASASYSYATITESDGKVTFTNCCQNSVYCSQGPGILISKSNFPINNEGFILDADYSIAQSSAGHSLVAVWIVGDSMYGDPIGDWDRHYGISSNTYSTDKTDACYPPEYNGTNDHLLDYVLGDPYRHIVKYTGSTLSNVTVYDKNGQVAGSANYSYSYSDSATLRVMLYVESPGSFINDVKLRKYASPEPSATVGDEQSSLMPQVLLHFGEGSGSTAYDATAHNNDCSLSGTSFKKGILGTGLYFSGSASSSCGNIGNIKTLSFFVNPLSLNQPILDLDGGTNYIELSSGKIHLVGNGWQSPKLYVNGKQIPLDSNNYSTNTLSQAQWYHIEIVNSASISASALTLGKVDASYFVGTLDELRFYNYQRTLDQIKIDFNSGLGIRFR